MALFGVGKVEVLGRELSRRGAKRTLIVTGKTLGQSKLLDKVKSAAGNALAGVFTGAAQHVPSQTVTELVAEARRVDADAMVSFGGGSPIDTVKNAAWQLMGGRAETTNIASGGVSADHRTATECCTWLQDSPTGPRAGDAAHPIVEARARGKSGSRGTRSFTNIRFSAELREGLCGDVCRAMVSDVQSRELDLKLLDFFDSHRKARSTEPLEESGRPGSNGDVQLGNL